MNTKTKITKQRKPTAPGVILKEEFLLPLQISQAEASRAMSIPYQRLNELVRGQRSLTASTALKLAQYLNTTPQFWMNLQNAVNLYETENKERKALAKIKQHTATSLAS